MTPEEAADLEKKAAEYTAQATKAGIKDLNLAKKAIYDFVKGNEIDLSSISRG
jgi:thiamine biosynthesis lipoprotein ApbE